MFKWKSLVYAIVVVVVFLVLTIIAVIEYNDKNVSHEKQNKLYQRINDVIEAADDFFSAWPVGGVHKNKEQSDLNNEKWAEKFRDYFQISRDKEGLIVIIRNSQGEIVNRVLPIFKRIKE